MVVTQDKSMNGTVDKVTDFEHGGCAFEPLRERLYRQSAGRAEFRCGKYNVTLYKGVVPVLQRERSQYGYMDF